MVFNNEDSIFDKNINNQTQNSSLNANTSRYINTTSNMNKNGKFENSNNYYLEKEVSSLNKFKFNSNHLIGKSPNSNNSSLQPINTLKNKDINSLSSNPFSVPPSTLKQINNQQLVNNSQSLNTNSTNSSQIRSKWTQFLDEENESESGDEQFTTTIQSSKEEEEVKEEYL